MATAFPGRHDLEPNIDDVDDIIRPLLPGKCPIIVMYA